MENRFLILLVFLLGVLLLLPAMAGSQAGTTLVAVSYGAMLVAGVRAVEGGWLRNAALALAVPAIGLDAVDMIQGARDPSLASVALDATFLAFVGGAILRHIMRKDEMSRDLVLGGLCVYLFLGILFAQIYVMMELAAPGSFRGLGAEGPGLAGHMVPFTYFSLVTLTTLGYGDVAPALPLARAFASVEAVLGQIYIAVFVGSLVAQRVASLTRPSVLGGGEATLADVDVPPRSPAG